jgi:hypothetical protein
LHENNLEAVAVLLQKKDDSVRRYAGAVIAEQLSLSPRILKNCKAVQAIAAWIVGPYNRDSALSDVLRYIGKYLNLPSEIIDALVAYLNIKEARQKSIAISVIGDHPELPKDIINVLKLRLDDESNSTLLSAFSALRKQFALSEEVINQYAKPIYEGLLERSLYDDCSWYYLENKRYIDVSGSIAIIECENLHDQIEKQILEVQTKLDIPRRTEITA